MLFKVIASKDIFELSPELKSIVEFERLTPRQMTYVALVADYKSPFRKLPIEDKKLRAAATAGYQYEKDGKKPDKNMRSVMDDKVQNINAAIKKYNELQHDEDYETLMGVNKLIEDVREFNGKKDKTPRELEVAMNLTVGKLDKLLTTKKKIQEILENRVDMGTPENKLSEEGDEDITQETNLTLIDQLDDDQDQK